MGAVVNVYGAKTGLSDLLRRVERGEEVVIARAGQPVAKLVAVRPVAAREPGTWAPREGFRYDPAVFAPLSDEEMRAEGWG